ncbi:MAG: OmpA family protein [Desulfobulbaceae bacterium]|nr:OmpA family protein [Desulfobulbaceae bacterium]
MNKLYFKKHILFLSLAVIISAMTAISCSSPKETAIKPIVFPAVSEIQKGESAKLSWQFEGAEKIRIENLRRNYDPIDSLTVKPDATTIYNFLAIRGVDTVLFKWHVFVKMPEDIITTGTVQATDATPSFLQSEYFSGIIDYSANVKPKNFRILSHMIDNDKINLNLLVFDEFGNFIEGLNNNSKFGSDLVATMVDIPSEKITNLDVLSFKKYHYDSKHIDLAVLLDNSAIAGDYYPIFDNFKSFAKGLRNKDRIMFRSFNQKINTSVALQNADKFNNFIRNLGIEKASGFSAVYKSGLSTLQSFASMQSDNKKILVLIAYSTDNASLVYDRNDLVEFAVSRGIPIYVIGIGNAVDTYSLKYLCDNTGGKYYGLDDSQISDLPKVFNEISFSVRKGYELTLAYNEQKNPTENYRNIIISHNTILPRIADTVKIPIAREKQFFRYQAVASFEQRDTVLSRDFDETISTLARVLSESPGRKIELIGNSSIEGNDEESQKLALKRAQEVRRRLIELGADPAMIRIRSEGSSNPIYYLQNSYWAQYYNRRVELRWLDPDYLPFEIISGYRDSEFDALLQVEEWENIGYRSYYDRVLQNNSPVYRVKIWGYKTQQDAEEVASKLAKRYTDFKFEIR